MQLILALISFRPRLLRLLRWFGCGMHGNCVCSSRRFDISHATTRASAARNAHTHIQRRQYFFSSRIFTPTENRAFSHISPPAQSHVTNRHDFRPPRMFPGHKHTSAIFYHNCLLPHFAKHKLSFSLRGILIVSKGFFGKYVYIF